MKSAAPRSHRLVIPIQWAIEADRNAWPTASTIRHWVRVAVGAPRRKGTIVIRMVTDAEIQALNRQYRHQDKPTNVLAFPAMPAEEALHMEGDVVVSVPTVEREAHAMERPVHAHMAHLVIHGCLHLLGWDHIDPAEAAQMEAEEVQILAQLGFPNPYLPLSTPGYLK